MKRAFLFILLLFMFSPAYSQTDYETNFLQGYLDFETFFQQLSGDYGTTFFPFLVIGYGGRDLGLSGAFTSVADDITTLESNPAGTASLKNTELYFSHNKLMGDVNYNTLAYSMRFNDLAFGVGGRVLYMPFTHFDSYGENVGSSVITYSVITFNIAYNFLRTYKFFGLSTGANVKLYIYNVPEVIAANQSRVNVAFDLGLLTRFNLLKFYNRSEKNFSLGFAVCNLGPFTDNEPPPTTLSFGISYKPIYQILISVDFNYLINYSELTYLNWSVNTGMEFKFTKYSSFLLGATIKSSPSFSLGVNLEFDDFKISAIYNPDFVDVSKFSISAGLKLGDLGRGNKEIKVKRMYSTALRFMTEGNYESSRDILKEILKTDRTFTPAADSLRFCNKQLKLSEELDIIINEKRLK